MISLIVLGAIGVYQLYYAMVVGYYVNRNHHRSLEYAIMRENEWQKNKPADDDDDLFGDDDEEEDEAEAGDAANGDAAADDDDDDE